ncbi:hypothetical protein L1887_55272 [Cichorium endivia]|nr:hypothetical protein L1887_55272 [Cichorium endivia]
MAACGGSEMRCLRLSLSILPCRLSWPSEFVCSARCELYRAAVAVSRSSPLARSLAPPHRVTRTGAARPCPLRHRLDPLHLCRCVHRTGAASVRIPADRFCLRRSCCFPSLHSDTRPVHASASPRPPHTPCANRRGVPRCESSVPEPKTSITIRHTLLKRERAAQLKPLRSPSVLAVARRSCRRLVPSAPHQHHSLRSLGKPLPSRPCQHFHDLHRQRRLHRHRRHLLVSCATIFNLDRSSWLLITSTALVRSSSSHFVITRLIDPTTVIRLSPSSRTWLFDDTTARTAP